MKSRIFLAVLLSVFMFLAFGCASLRHAGYKTDYIHSQVQDYAYTSENFSEVWGKARELLFENGYQVRGPGLGYNVETDWALTGEHTQHRYMVTSYAVQDCAAYVVHFDYVEEDNSAGYSSTRNGRDYDMEYELLRRVDYNQWSRIQNDATRYADERLAAEK